MTNIVKFPTARPFDEAPPPIGLAMRTRPGVPRRPGLATASGHPQTALERDAHSSRCGVKIAVRQSGTFSKLLP